MIEFTSKGWRMDGHLRGAREGESHDKPKPEGSDETKCNSPRN